MRRNFATVVLQDQVGSQLVQHREDRGFAQHVLGDQAVLDEAIHARLEALFRLGAGQE